MISDTIEITVHIVCLVWQVCLIVITLFVLFFGENPQVVAYSAQPSYKIRAKSVYIYRCWWKNWYWYIYYAIADTMSLKWKRNSYDAQLKLKVIKFAEENNNSAADWHFAVSEKLVKDWRKQKKYLFEMLRAKRYRVSPYIKLETALNDWVLEYRHRMMIRIQAVKFTRDKQYEVETWFKASPGWCSWFMNRCVLTLRQRTHNAQKLPKDVEVK